MSEVQPAAARPELSHLQKVVARRLMTLLKEATDPVGKAILTKLISDTVNNKLDLPRLPTLVGQLRQIDPMSKASGKRLSAIVARDPDVAARIMQVANSARYSTRRVNDLTEAVNRVGLQFVKQVAVGSVISKAVFSAGGFTKEMAQFRRQGFQTAVGCAMLARSTRQDKLAGPVFLAGLFHDVGAALILRNVTTVEGADAAVEPLPTTTRQVGAALGAHYVRTRKMSADICSAVAFASHPHKAPEEHRAMTWLIWAVSRYVRASDDEQRVEALRASWPAGAPDVDAVAKVIAAVETLK